MTEWMESLAQRADRALERVPAAKKAIAWLGLPGRLIKPFLPRSLLGRFLLILIMPLILVQLVSLWIFFDRHLDHITRRLASTLAGDVLTIVELVQNTPESAKAELMAIVEDGMSVQIDFTKDNALPPDNTTGERKLERVLQHLLDQGLIFDYSLDTVSAAPDAVVYVQMLDGVLRIRIDSIRLFKRTSDILIGWMVGSSILFFLIATIFMRNQVRTIRRLSLAADRFGKGHDVPDFKPEGAREVRQAASAFIKMRERIKRHIEQRTQMLAGVSHDLRTPLTRMKLSLALMGDGPEIRELKSDVDEMEHMIEGYLAFARGESEEERQSTDLAELLRGVVEQTQREGSRAITRDIAVNIDGPAVLSLRREAMRRCLQNLISNACRHGKRVEVQLAHSGNQIEIVVDDDGPGIDESQREEVFKPFVRLDKSRNPETGGTGLGLTISRDVVRNHGGELVLATSPLGGLRARLTLPA